METADAAAKDGLKDTTELAVASQVIPAHAFGVSVQGLLPVHVLRALGFPHPVLMPWRMVA